MSGESDLQKLIRSISPKLNEGEYVFVVVENTDNIDCSDVICEFKELEGVTLIIKKESADKLNLLYNFVASWITLKVYSSLKAVGLTAIISTELAKYQISCNVVAGYYHDHLFVNVKGAEKAIQILNKLSKNY